MTTREARSFCRICGAGCGMRLMLDENSRLVGLQPDREHPMSHGYTCFKGLNAVDLYGDPNRIARTLKRNADGDFDPIGVEQALDEVAEKLIRIRAEHGVESIATFLGTAGYQSFTARPFLEAFTTALGTPSNFGNGTIDQSAKWIAAQRLGFWAAGKPTLEESEVSLLVGTNPLVSRFTLGLFGPDPARTLKRAKANGLKLIVIDPRRTETAHHADIHLQPFPGEDVSIAAGLIRLILANDWEDKAFCDAFVKPGHMAWLAAAVQPFTPDHVASRAGIEASQLVAAAEMFATARTGAMNSATGPSMSPRSNLAEHLLECINVLCGRYRRAGDKVRAVTPWMPKTESYAMAVSPSRSWESLPPSRIRGARSIIGQMFTATLADEILTPGEGQIRALINEGGNPASAIPDMDKVVRALRSLDLMVSIEPARTTSARLSHYIFAPRLQYERQDLPATIPGYPLFPIPWGQYEPGIVRPPDGAELIDDWYFYWGIAKRLGLQLDYNGVALNMETAPDNDELFEIGTRGSIISLDEIKRHPGGKVYDIEQHVLPVPDDRQGRFEPMPDDIEAELREVAVERRTGPTMSESGLELPFLLTVRRSQDLMNTFGLHSRGIRERNPHNPLSVHPEDLASLGCAPGERVDVVSDHGRIPAIVEADKTLRRGTVSIAHGWGDLPEGNGAGGSGASVNRLISSDHQLEPINSMPRMSAIPVAILPIIVSRPV